MNKVFIIQRKISFVKPYYLLLLILLITISSSGAGTLTITDPKDLVVDLANDTTSHKVKYTIDDTAGATDGDYAFFIIPKGSTCPTDRSTFAYNTGSASIKMGVEFEFDIIPRINKVYSIQSNIIDAEETYIDDEKGRYLCISAYVIGLIVGTQNTIRGKLFTIRIWKDYKPDSGGGIFDGDGNGFFGDLPIGNYYLFSLFALVLMYRKRVKT